MSSNKTLIDFHNATLYRNNKKVFDNLNLKIRTKDQVAILGPNGSGKTTLLKAINREIYPVFEDGAWIKILGKETWNVWDLRSKLGIVSNELQIIYNKNITGINVVLSGYLSSIGTHGLLAKQITKINKSSAETLMKNIGIEHLSNIPLKKMSTGEQRRCLLARALVHSPDTLILDEPTTGLDLLARCEYLDLINRLILKGRNIILVTHRLDEIPPEINRIVMIRNGTIIIDGPKKDVINEKNLQLTFGISVGLKVLNNYYLTYPKNNNK